MEQMPALTGPCSLGSLHRYVIHHYIFDSLNQEVDMENEEYKEVEEYDYEPDDSQLEVGFDPYLGCYTDDC